MTISKEERKRALEQAFNCIVETVGDEDFTFFEFDADMPGFTELPKTTLKELEDHGILERTDLIAVESYKLSASGWIKVLGETGQLRTAENLRRAGILAGVLKNYVKGRQRDELVTTNEVLSEIAPQGVPEGWLYSTVHSSLLSVLWPSRQMDVYFDDPPMYGYLHIPARFGMDDEGVID